MVGAAPSPGQSPLVSSFVGDDGPRLAIENEARQRRHRMSIPVDLRIPLIELLRRVQRGELKVQERPLSVTCVSSTTVAGTLDPYVIVHYHERIPGNGVRLHRLPLRQEDIESFIHALNGGTYGLHEDPAAHPNQPTFESFDL